MRRYLKRLVAWYLGFLTKAVVRRYHPTVIGITGITNKTTTKRAILEQLRAWGQNVRGNPKSYNTEIGLPLAVLALQPEGRGFWDWASVLWQGTATALLRRTSFPSTLVLEFGVSERGDMARLLKILRPHIAVFTNVVPSDRNPNATVSELTGEMRTLLQSLPKNGLAILNTDDTHLRNLYRQSPVRAVTYGLASDADVRAEAVSEDSGGLCWTQNGQVRRLPKFGQHHLYAALAAAAVARELAPYG